MSLALLFLILASPPLAERPADAALDASDTVVVCPDGFRDALDPWLDYRRSDGHRITVVSNLASPIAIRRQIQTIARGGHLKFVVLIGEGKLAMQRDPTLRARSIPMHYAKARINVLWGSESYLSTDAWYGEAEAGTDENPKPEFAVGRITANSPDDLRRTIAKIIAYERSSDFGPWRQRINVMAGAGGFGMLADMALESATRYFLTDTIPASYDLSMTYGNWQSPYCPDPRRFRQTAVDRLNEGSLFWIYIGHGYHLGLAPVSVPGREYPTLDVPDAAALHCDHGRPIALFLSCYAGAIDATQDCLAESLLRAPGGPVAILAGTRVTMPYAMTVMGTALTDEFFQGSCETLGEAVLHAKREMLKEPAVGDRRRALLDTIAAAISPAPGQLAAERAEHVLMFNLIGDPLLRLRRPKPIAIAAPKTIDAGSVVEIMGTCPVDGRGTLELALRRDRLPMEPPDRSTYPKNSDELSKFQETYERANDRRLASVEVEVRNGRFTTQLEIPRSAIGECHLGLYIQGKDDFASGAVDLRVTQAERAAIRRLPSAK